MIGSGGKAVEITPEGGLAFWIENQTGEVSVKGKLICPSQTTDDAVELVAVDEVDPNGVIYDAGVAIGGRMRVVFSGKAHVLFSNAATRHFFARCMVAADAGAANGLAISEALPVPPLATDKHFRECGHILETTGGAGLALTNLHFN